MISWLATMKMDNSKCLYVDIFQLKSGRSVETLQTCRLRWHHMNVSISGTRQEQIGRRVLLPTVFRESLTAVLDHTKVITNAIGAFITANMQPHMVLENKGFKHMVKLLEPHYNVPSSVHFSQSVALPYINEHKLQLFRNYQQVL